MSPISEKPVHKTSKNEVEAVNTKKKNQSCYVGRRCCHSSRHMHADSRVCADGGGDSLAIEGSSVEELS